MVPLNFSLPNGFSDTVYRRKSGCPPPGKVAHDRLWLTKRSPAHDNSHTHPTLRDRRWEAARAQAALILRDAMTGLVERERRVEAHIFLCVLAYHLLVSIASARPGDTYTLFSGTLSSFA